LILKINTLRIIFADKFSLFKDFVYIRHMETMIFNDNIYLWSYYKRDEYLPHIFCLQGSVNFILDGKPYCANAGDCIIASNKMSALQILPTDDFQCRLMFILNKFVDENRPTSQYAIVGHLGTMQQPIIHLMPTEMEQCLRNIENLRLHYNQPYHTFYNEALKRAFELFAFDMYDIHARQGNIELKDAPQAGILMRRFIAMLQGGECLTQRQPSYYARKLCVTSGYLTEISTSVTQHSPTFWIDYFTRQMLIKLLADKKLTLKDISDMMQFSSLSYFSRYCKRVLGVPPSKLGKE
jgi:AraC-like DNA-binding protein